MNYTTCRQAIARLLSCTEREYIPLDTALGRVSTANLGALIPQPEFRQSLRDGYLVGSYDEHNVTELHLPVEGMIQAGNTTKHAIASGEVYRIMTGGMVPENGVRVIPQEDCHYDKNTISISASVLNSKNTFIQEQGSQIGVGEVVVNSGIVLGSEHTSILAAVGCMELEVYRRPRVGFLCTGSELVDSPKELHPGLKISSNRHLLHGLILHHGADPIYLGTVNDSHEAMTEVFERIQAGHYDMVISTGGMGPGKFDLIEQTFIDAGGEVLYNSLDLRPGKASLCGVLGRTLFFGLPGPPTAVRALMNAIVGPSLMQMQGVQAMYPKMILAHLEHQIIIKRSGVMQLRGGVISFANGQCMVRESDRLEPSSCYVVLDAKKAGYAAGELIEVHLKESPFGNKN